jgi:AcrR family transcriptional regulator
LKEAANMFVARGYNGISMREISETLRVTKAALYYHFKDKEALLMAILTGYLDELELLIDTNCPPQLHTRTRVTNLMRSIFAQPPERRAIIRLASQEMPQLGVETRKLFGELYRKKFIGKIEIILREGIRRGELRLMDVPTATWILLGMMYPFFYSSPEVASTPGNDAITLMVEVFFDGAGS